MEVEHAYPDVAECFLEQADLPKVVKQAKEVSGTLKWVAKGYEVITLTASCGLMLKFEGLCFCQTMMILKII